MSDWRWQEQHEQEQWEKEHEQSSDFPGQGQGRVRADPEGQDQPRLPEQVRGPRACIEAVEDALLKNGIALMWKTHPDDSGVTVECVLQHDSGEQITSGPLHLPATKQDAQGFGSAMTYGRRYTLQAVCGIAAEDDDSNAASRPAKAQPTRLDGPRGVMAAVLKDEPPLREGREQYIDGLAGDLIEEHGNGRTGESLLQAIEAEKLDDTERMYLWSKLPSAVRTSIKTKKAVTA